MKHILSGMTSIPIKWRQRPDMTFAVDWDVKQIESLTNSFVNFEQLGPDW